MAPRKFTGVTTAVDADADPGVTTAVDADADPGVTTAVDADADPRVTTAVDADADPRVTTAVDALPSLNARSSTLRSAPTARRKLAKAPFRAAVDADADGRITALDADADGRITALDADADRGITTASPPRSLFSPSAPGTPTDLGSVNAVKPDLPKAIEPERGRNLVSADAGPSAANSTQDMQKVGFSFVEKFYNTLVSAPEKLHMLYSRHCDVSWNIYGRSYTMKSGLDVQNVMAKEINYLGDFKFGSSVVTETKHTIHIVVHGVHILDNTSSNFVQSFELNRRKQGSILSDVLFALLNVPQVSHKSKTNSTPVITVPSNVPNASTEISRDSTLAVKAPPNVRHVKLTIKNIPAGKGTHNDSTDTAIRGADHSEVLLVYNKACSLHIPPINKHYYENPDRLAICISSLRTDGVLTRVVVQGSDPADRKHLLAVHSEKYLKEVFDKLPLTDEQREKSIYVTHELTDLYCSDGTKEAILFAAGAVIKACECVANGMFKKSFALVRPPGHHASANYAEGFCFVNNAAVGVRYLQSLGFKRIMLVDIDVHHANGSQSIFYEDDSVLVFSIHGKFLYPKNRTAKSHTSIGEGKGKCFNVNVPLVSNFGNADMLYAIDHVLAPLVQAFQPEKIVVSAGFDAVEGDLVGTCSVTPRCFGTVTKKLVEFGDGNLIMCLEGGYGEALGGCVSNCLRSLLGDEDSCLSDEELRTLAPPESDTVDTVRQLNKWLKKNRSVN